MAAAKPVDDDFDAWYADEVHPYRFRLLGKVWELPAEAPAIVKLRYQKLMQLVLTLDPGEEIPQDRVPDGLDPDKLTNEGFLRDLAGDLMVDEWLALGLTDKRVDELAKRLMGRYVLDTASEDDGEAGQGKAPQDHKPPAKKTASRPRKSSTGSSRTGRP